MKKIEQKCMCSECSKIYKLDIIMTNEENKNDFGDKLIYDKCYIIKKQEIYNK